MDLKIGGCLTMRNKDYNNLVITISGLHGTGKSTYANRLSKIFHLRRVSAGELFRQIAKEKGVTLSQLSVNASLNFDIDKLIDERVKEEAAKGYVVIDGLLSAWMAKDVADIRIFLSASDETRFKRISSRDKLTYEQAKNSSLEREKIERERFKRYYGIDIDDLSRYDVVLNTELLPLDSNVKILAKIVNEYIKLKRGNYLRR
jgi:cytidylate kinase